MTICKIEGCKNTATLNANTICRMHYLRNNRHGSYELRKPPAFNHCEIPGCVELARSRGGKYCGAHYQRIRATGSPDLAPRARYTTCTIDDCSKPVRSAECPLCEMHYYRHRRNGHFDLLPASTGHMTSTGYFKIPAHRHPLTQRHSQDFEFEHRVVYYAANGDGPFHCYHCDIIVTWDDLDIDHLNDVKTDNRIVNLVASCPSCNTKRGRHKMIATLRAKGIQITAFGRTRSLHDWADDLQISHASVLWRIENGWSPEDAVSKPRGKTGPKSCKTIKSKSHHSRKTALENNFGRNKSEY